MKKILCFSFLSMALVASSPANPGPLYHFIKSIPVSGDGGWDYLSVDPQARRLYMSHGSSVVVLDLNTDTIVGSITNTPGVHGLAPAPELNLGFVSDGRENKASIVDLKTLQTIAKVDTGKNPDGMLYEPGRKEAYLFNGRSQSATVIDASSRKVVATIPLDGKPEFAVADPEAGRVYDNLENQNVVAVIDTTTHQVVDRWPISPGEEGSGMAIDVAHHRLFIGAGGSDTMVMMDSANGHVITSVPIAKGVDACAFDPGTQLAFSSCGNGTTTIAHEDSPDKLTIVQKLATEISARTMTLDPQTHRIYLPAAKFEAPEPGRRRGKMIPGTLHLLVYGME